MGVSRILCNFLLLHVVIFHCFSTSDSLRVYRGGGGRGRSPGGGSSRPRRSNTTRTSRSTYSSSSRSTPSARTSKSRSNYSRSTSFRPASSSSPNSYVRQTSQGSYKPSWRRSNYNSGSTYSSSSRSATPRSTSSSSQKSYGRNISQGSYKPSWRRKSADQRPGGVAPQRSKPGYTYRLDLGGGRKYVGSTTNPRRRIAQHNSGRGARYTSANSPKGVDYVRKHRDANAARKAETAEYFQAKKEYGDGVRGAGNTKSK